MRMPQHSFDCFRYRGVDFCKLIIELPFRSEEVRFCQMRRGVVRLGGQGAGDQRLCAREVDGFNAAARPHKSVKERLRQTDRRPRVAGIELQRARSKYPIAWVTPALFQ